MKNNTMKNRVFAFGVAAAVSLAVLPLGAADISPNPQQMTRNVDVASDTTITGFANNGVLRKRGAGTLTLSAPRLNNGEVVIESGEAVLDMNATSTVPALPSHLDDNIALWLDATTNVVTDGGGNVEYWFDRREDNPTAGAASHSKPFASSHVQWVVGSDGAGAPSLATANGMTYVDFGPHSGGDQGTYANGKWLCMTNVSGSTYGLVGMVEAFVVVAKHSTSTGYTNGLATIFSGYYNGANCNPIWCGGLSQNRLWFSNDNTRADKGSTRLDRNAAWGAGLTIGDTEFHLLSTRVPVDYSSNSNDKWNMIGADRGNTSGGVRIAEIIAFKDRISEFDRMRVEDYLWRKWFGSRQLSVGMVSVNTNATATIDTDFDIVGDLSGGGSIVKTGSGRLRVPSQGFTGTVELREGSVRSDFAPIKVMSTGKHFLATAASVVSIDAVAEAGVVAKAGQGVMTIASLPANTAKLAVEKGTLNIAPPVPMSIPTAAAISNGGFEDFAPIADFNNIGGGSGTSTAQTSNSWTFDRTGRNANNAVTLVNNSYNTGTFKLQARDYVDVGYEGAVSLLLCQGKASTTFNLPASGIYKASFRVAGHGSNVFDAQVLVDGIHVREFTALASGLLTRYEVELPFLTAGEHTFTISDVVATQTNRILFDDLNVLPVELRDAAPDSVTIVNPSFELPWSNVGSTTYDQNAYAPSKDNCTGWTLRDSGDMWAKYALRRRWFNGMGSTSYLANGLASNPDEMPDGFVCAQIFSAIPVSQSNVSFPSAGRYRLRFHLARRQGSNPQNVSVKVGGAIVRRIVVRHDEFRPYEAIFDLAEGGSRTLEFVGDVASSVNGYSSGCALLDGISCERISDIPSGDLVVNGRFENGLAGWTRNDGYMNVISKFDLNNWVDGVKQSPLQGTNSFGFAIKSPTATISQDITFPNAGRYELSFRMRTFDADPETLTRLHKFMVHVGDNRLLLRSALADNEERVVTLPFTVAEACTKPLVFTLMPYNIGSTRINVLIDDVSIVAGPRDERTGEELAAFIPRNMEIAVTESGNYDYDRSYLNLDFDGVAKVAKVTYKGEKMYGEISHETCPTWVMGRGRLLVVPGGTIISFR